MLVLATYVVLRLARREHGLLALGAWLVSLLVAVPLLVRLTSVHGSAALEMGLGGDTERFTVSVAAGPEGLQTTLLIWLVAALVAAALAFATGRADPQQARALVARAGSAVQRNPGRAAQGTPPTGTFPGTTPPPATSSTPPVLAPVPAGHPVPGRRRLTGTTKPPAPLRSGSGPGASWWSRWRGVERVRPDRVPVEGPERVGLREHHDRDRDEQAHRKARADDPGRERGQEEQDQ